MTTNEKIELLQNQNYEGTGFDLEIKDINGTIMCNCYYNDTKYSYEFFEDIPMYNIEDIEVIEYNGKWIPVAKTNMEHFKKCETCGEWLCLDYDDFIEDDNGNYYHDCYACTDDEVFYCEYHEQYERCYERDEHTVNTRHGEQTWCESAVDEDAFWSEYSEEYWSGNDYDYERVYYNHDGGYYIWERNEAIDYAYYCEHCDNFYTDDMYDCDNESCLRCNYSSLINRYHYSKENGTLHFFGESKYVNPVGLGFELEIDTDYSTAQRNQVKLLKALKERFGDRITFERDGSLENGFEIISAPHTKDEMSLVDWGELMELCKEHGYKSHDAGTCGLHFHISGYMFGATKEKQYDTIAKVIAFYERYFNDFIALSRRGSETRWGAKYGVIYNGNMEDYKAKCKALATPNRYRDRYYAINLTNVDWSNNLYKTVEFRINRGTLNINTFNATWDLIVTMIKNAKKIDWNDSDFFNPKKWLKGCKANTYAYIVKRHAFEGTFHLINTTQETEYTQENA